MKKESWFKVRFVEGRPTLLYSRAGVGDPSRFNRRRLFLISFATRVFLSKNGDFEKSCQALFLPFLHFLSFRGSAQ
jgi:hypothetical protein